MRSVSCEGNNMFSVTYRRDGAWESLMSYETNTIRCSFIVSEVMRTVVIRNGKSFSRNQSSDLLQPEEDADGAGLAPESGDAIGI